MQSQGWHAEGCNMSQYIINLERMNSWVCYNYSLRSMTTILWFATRCILPKIRACFRSTPLLRAFCVATLGINKIGYFLALSPIILLEGESGHGGARPSSCVIFINHHKCLSGKVSNGGAPPSCTNLPFSP